MNLSLELVEPLARGLRRIHDNGLDHRIAWTTDGWYITLRKDDIKLGHNEAWRFMDIRQVGDEVVAGPFKTRELLVGWFRHFVEDHGRPRDINRSIGLQFTFA